MNGKMFRSKFTLYYISTSIEKEYQLMKSNTIKTFNPFITLLFFIISLLVTILISFNIDFLLKAESFLKTMISTCLVTVFFMVMLPLSFFLKSRTRLQLAINYINFTLILFIFSFLRYYISMIKSAEQMIYFMFLISDFISKLIFITFGLIDFLDTLILCIINDAFLIAYFIPTIAWEDLMVFFISYTVLLIILIFISYFFTFQRKKTFYYNYELEQKIKWYKGVQDNMNTGFMYIKNRNVNYINKTLYDKYIRIRNNGQQFPDDIISTLLSDLKIENNENVNYSLDDLKHNYSNNFNFIGVKKLELRNENESQTADSSKIDELYYEVFYRYYENTFEQKSEDFEFIFNDVTRTKIQEKKNAEFKYKTLFLAKIAHEFKNPLICINELADQINEAETILKKNDILDTIKSLSEYLLILVKDLDYFSEKQTKNNLNLEIGDVNIDALLQFCSHIGEGLIKKAGKKELKIVAKKDNGVKYLKGDEIRLKQILVNLLSNSIKFSNKGLIEVSIELIGENIRFTVTDHGKGIPPSMLSEIFKPFKKGSDANNKYGAGLGLNIVYDLTTQMGNSIQCSSNVGEGSKFWFELPYRDETIIFLDNIAIERFNSDNTITNRLTSIIPSIHKSNINVIRHSTTAARRSQSSHSIKQPQHAQQPQQQYYSEDSSDTVELKNINLSRNFPFSSLFKEANNKPQQPRYNIYNNEYHINQNTYNNIIITNNNDYSAKLMNSNINIIVIDDESLTRQSSIRNIKKIATEKNMLINIIEAEDGYEGLYYYFRNISDGINISCIISDENMYYMNGSHLSQIIGRIMELKNLRKVPFFLLTAYEDDNTLSSLKNVYIQRILSKPLNLINTREILNLI